ncbi:hypothetical protein [Mesorhizobium sp. STM 4661]|uniref:hypothetical protein n=1 Tax=Mesorhizobium sp. STM 4661 TaxID=1297570 RepID=UPI0002BFF3B6|nr:hypothetical protein [Mesorhizobium sp. STM 4661]CCV15027.1 hypothetical protein MESS4_740010 [Mesorhizobium sp. STM 4661]
MDTCALLVTPPIVGWRGASLRDKVLDVSLIKVTTGETYGYVALGDSTCNSHKSLTP